MKWLHLLKHNTPRVHLRSHGTFHRVLILVSPHTRTHTHHAINYYYYD